MSNPYKTSPLSQVYGHLTLNGGTAALTEIAETLNITYHSIYGAISRDINKEGAIIFITEGGVRCAALADVVRSDNINQSILGVMRGAEAMTIKEIAKAAGVMEVAATEFIREQNKLGNIDIAPARNQANYRYEWVGHLAIKEEVLELAKEVEVESIAKARLEPTAKLELPDSVTAQPENVTAESKQAANQPKTFTNLPKDITNTEDIATTQEPQSNAPAIATPSVNPKIGYMITAAKGKMERRKNHEAARKLAEQWKKGGHKNVAIHSTLEMERPRLEIRFG